MSRCSVGAQSVDKWSVVGGSVVGGFNKTQPKNSQVINFDNYSMHSYYCRTFL